jgi:hypothetical protein
MIASKAACPAFSVEKSKSDADMDIAIFDEHKDLFQYLTEHAGQPINNISDVEWLYDTLLIEVMNIILVLCRNLFIYYSKCICYRKILTLNYQNGPTQCFLSQ